MTKTMTNEIKTAVNTMIVSCGFRFSTVDMTRLGVKEYLIFDAVTLGMGRIERTFINGVSTYLMYA